MNQEYKYKKMMDCLNKWMQNREKEKRIKDYLDRYSLSKVAIYGYGILGKHAFQELEADGVDVRWIMDRNVENEGTEIPLVSLNQIENVEKVDIVIVTPIMDVDDVYSYLSQYLDAKIVSIDEIIEVLQSQRKSL